MVKDNDGLFRMYYWSGSMPLSIESNEDSKHTLEQLRAVVNEVTLFQQAADCVQFLETVKKEKALVITSGSLGQDLVQQIHHMAQINAIYIFCGNPARHEPWAAKWSKVKGVYDRDQTYLQGTPKFGQAIQ